MSHSNWWTKSGSRTPDRHLPVVTLGAGVHLAIVFGVIAEEGRLAVVEPDHAAVVRVVLAVAAEQLPAQDVSARGQRLEFTFTGLSIEPSPHRRHSLLLAGDILLCCWAFTEGVVGSSGVLVVAVLTGHNST